MPSFDQRLSWKALAVLLVLAVGVLLPGSSIYQALWVLNSDGSISPLPASANVKIGSAAPATTPPAGSINFAGNLYQNGVLYSGATAAWTKHIVDVSSNAGFWTVDSAKGAALAGAGTQAVALVTLPARTVVHAVLIKQSVALAGTSITAATAQLGIAATPGALMLSTSDVFDVLQAVSDTTMYIVGGAKMISAATVPLVVTVATTGANISALTTGTFEVTLLASTLP